MNDMAAPAAPAAPAAAPSAVFVIKSDEKEPLLGADAEEYASVAEQAFLSVNAYEQRLATMSSRLTWVAVTLTILSAIMGVLSIVLCHFHAPPSLALLHVITPVVRLLTLSAAVALWPSVILLKTIHWGLMDALRCEDSDGFENAGDQA